VSLTLAAAAMTVAAASGGAAEVLALPPAAGVALFASAVAPAAGYAAARELRQGIPAGLGLTAADAGRLFAVAAAAPVTRWLAVDAGLGAVTASALVGLVAGLAVPRFAVPAYCGSFVGMAGPGLLSVPAVAAAGVLAGVVFVAAKRVFDGFGGKLGTTAFVGCAAVVLLTGATPGVAGPAPSPRVTAVSVAAAGAAAVATYALSIRLDHGPVIGSAAVGLVAGLAADPLAGGTVAAAAFCASFAGMASPDRLPGEGPVLVAGLLSGALVVAVAPAFVGFGGKLGTVAFVACLAVRGLLSAGRVVLPAGVGTPS
jgi:hypothetical protein